MLDLYFYSVFLAFLALVLKLHEDEHASNPPSQIRGKCVLEWRVGRGGGRVLRKVRAIREFLPVPLSHLNVMPQAVLPRSLA